MFELGISLGIPLYFNLILTFLFMLIGLLLLFIFLACILRDHSG